jgi:hypothetical protein
VRPSNALVERQRAVKAAAIASEVVAG